MHHKEDDYKINRPYPLTIHKREEMKALCFSYKPELSNARDGTVLEVMPGVSPVTMPHRANLNTKTCFFNTYGSLEKVAGKGALLSRHGFVQQRAYLAPRIHHMEWKSGLIQENRRSQSFFNDILLNDILL